MDYQEDRKYFGIVLPGEVYGKSYSSGSNKFYSAIADIYNKTKIQLLGGIKICQRLSDPNGRLDGFPCYIATLFGIRYRSSDSEKEDLIRLACRYMAGEESLIQVSFSEKEGICQEWLDFSKTWPGATVVKTHREGDYPRDVYLIIFPGRTD